MATSIAGDRPDQRGHRRRDEGRAGGDDPGGQVDAAGQHRQHLAGGEHGERDGELDRVAGPEGRDDAGAHHLQHADQEQQKTDQRDDRVVLEEPAKADEGADLGLGLRVDIAHVGPLPRIIRKAPNITTPTMIVPSTMVVTLGSTAASVRIVRMIRRMKTAMIGPRMPPIPPPRTTPPSTTAATAASR
jgi:hypothetical protein